MNGLSLEVVLDAKITNQEVWKVVEQKLREGFRVYSVNDFKSEMLTVLNEELEAEQRKAKVLEQKINQLEYERSVLKIELVPLRKLKEDVEALARAAADYATIEGGLGVPSESKEKPHERSGAEGSNAEASVSGDGGQPTRQQQPVDGGSEQCLPKPG